MTIIPFNFGKNIGRKDMSVNEDNIENDIEKEDYTDATTNKKVFQFSRYGYEFHVMVDNLLRLKVHFFIRQDRLAIIDQILDLKHHSNFPNFIEQAIIEKVERDLADHQNLVKDYCDQLLKKWDMNPDSKKRKSLQYSTNE